MQDFWAAEISLLRILQDEFQDKGDHFEKETRGSCGADIIQFTGLTM
jgi:hypothetical protein